MFGVMVNKLGGFMFIDDCIEGTMKIFSSKSSLPYNLGSNEQLSINQLIDIIEEISFISS